MTTSVNILRVSLVAAVLLTMGGTVKAQDAAVSTGPTIRGNVYGGGNLAEVQGSVTVNVKGGTVVNDVYGGGALASTNTANWDATLNDGAGGWAEGKTSATNTTTVNLTGGVVGNAYGGGLGDANTPAYVWGDVTVAVNGTMFTQTYQEYKNADESNIPKTGQVFGCNNINGSPKGNVTVHVFKTVVRNNEGTVEDKPTRKSGIYELLAVYGGGNLAPYEPVKANSESTDDDNTTTYDDNISSTNVIVDGCDLTSIKQVYGGGNAASTPSTKVTINGSYEIDEVFGGGNGKDNISATLENPGAHIGFRAYTDGNDTEKASAKYGRGVGRVNINGGIIHTVYGGSNTKGNVRRVAVAMLDKTSDESCFSVDEAYGGGKSAEMDGKAMLSLGCIPGVGTVYGGARAAKVNNDVVLTITNGTFTNVFGGNNEAGEIKGSITVNIEETGCRPIHITNLYGCGNQAPYATPEGKDDPTINILSCTSIDNVYGGGYGSTAVVTGNTQVNINMVKGRWSQANSPAETNPYNETGAVKLGTIGHVYGGGYGADVKGNTYVNVGTASTVRFTSLADNAETTEVDERVKNVEGANITGDVFGGGFGEETNVTGTAYVNVGEKRTTTTPADPDAGTEASTSVSYVAHDADVANGNFDGNIYGGSALGTVNNAVVNLYAGKITKEVFGGGQGCLAQAADNSDPANPIAAVEAQSATITEKATVTLFEANVASAIYGGCNVNGSAAVTEVNILGGTLGVAPDPNATSTTVAEVLFGGGKGQLTTTGTTEVNIGKATTADGDSPSTTYEGAATIYGNMYGGSALGAVGVSSSNEPTGSATVNLYKATSVTGDVFGDGMGSVTGAGVTARMGSSTVNLEGLDLTGNIYGGCNYNGIVYGTSTVNLKSGSSNDVFGGGQGERTYVKGDVLVNVGETEGTKDGLTINGDVYGGSAKGHVNAMPNTAQDATLPIIPQATTTTVNLQSGLIKGDAYGGGLGQKAGFNGASADVPAYVGGDIFVNLNGTAFDIGYTSEEGSGGQVDKSGRVFGANNLCGSPQGNVTVTVNKTMEGNTPKSDAADKTNENATFHVAAVYGGGNLADYTTTGKKANVVIKGCDKSSIRYVYGGGNAAAVPETDVQIEGAYEIEYVFGGGNGKDKYKNDTGWQTNPGANVNGNVKTTLMGGVIHEAYGGSNEKGRIGGSVSINTATIAGCTLDVAKVYGAGRNADIDGDLVMVMGCMPGDENPTNEVYGGAENANVKGNVELTITSGTFGKVFGGNNQSGAIFGHIIVNIEETGCRPIKIDELYLGGNEAAYSVYGYKNTGTADEPVYVARTSKDDGTAVTFDFNEHTVPDATTGQYDDPVLNVISCTHIGKVFGGGLGTGAKLYGNPVVNVNMTSGDYANGIPAVMESLHLSADDNPNKLAIIGTVYGGGNEANVEGNTTVNVGTEKTVTLKSAADDESTTDVDERVKSVLGAYIAGNVFGGGKGKDDTFQCEKGMVGKEETAIGNTNVTVGNGFVLGTVYGGGEIGRVENNAVVTIGLPGADEGTSKPVVKGNVFGAGKGVSTHGYAALVRGNTTVTVQADAKVLRSVYGGGEIASVGKYTIAKTDEEAAAHNVEKGEPYSLVSENRGICRVTVKGNAEIGPDGMKMEKEGGPDDTGYVFGAGKGVLPYEGYDADTKTWRMTFDEEHPYGVEELYLSLNEALAGTDEASYLKYIETLALATQTEVTISENAFIKGSVYGGSENGHVQHDTHVTIAGGQIGCGKNTTSRHPDKVWGANYTVPDGTNLECDHWTFAEPYAPYDLYKDADGNGTPDYATDGHTFFGNVFGGGSGYFPYRKNSATALEALRAVHPDYADGLWHKEAGSVGGNTVVDITGGHILTSVYGGNEQTDVKGSCTINITGGTIGVPRTIEQMKAHPVTCYVFGAGKGDPRINFNTSTNVASTQVNISGTARIYGSTFGGGEDGHVLGDAQTNIGGSVTIGGTTYTNQGVLIGTTGTSAVDGNIFGGGRGFSETALTAGVVGGNVSVNIHGGTMLGSIFGGGRLASVGTFFANAENENYGKMQDDDANGNHGHIGINIYGGQIGARNTDGSPVTSEFSIGDVFGGCKGTKNSMQFGLSKMTTINMSGGSLTGSLYGGGELAQVIESTNINVSGDAVIGVSSRGGATYGNIYGGGKGNTEDFQAGLIQGNTNVSVSGGTIYHNIYGGGAYGSVGTYTFDQNDKNLITGWTSGGKATIKITGGTIGENGDENGMVFGSSRGDIGAPGSIHDKLAWVYDTEVNIGTSGATDGPRINGSVYGGGENGHNYHDAIVNVYSGTVGITSGSEITGTSGTTYSGAAYPYRGNVYGAGCGTDQYDTDNDGKGDTYNPLAGIVRNEATVTISGGMVARNVYGAGAMGSVGKKDDTGAIISGGTTTINVSGGTVGVDGTQGDGNIFGAARGDAASTQDGLAQVKVTNVTISSGAVKGNVYGGGEAGDVGTYTSDDGGSSNTYAEGSGICNVTVTGGTIGSAQHEGHVFGAGKGVANTFTCQKAMVRETHVSIDKGTIYGNVYGGGEVGRVEYDTEVKIGPDSGTDTPQIMNSVYGGGAGVETHGYSALVRGNTNVTVQGSAKVGHSVYGGGEIASVGRYGLNAQKMPNILVGGGVSTVSVKGNATIGANVFGAGKGVEAHFVLGQSKRMTLNDNNEIVWESFQDEASYASYLETLALVTQPHVTIMETAIVDGSVFGGGELGITKGSVTVNIEGGTVTKDVYGGGALANTNTTHDVAENWPTEKPTKNGDGSIVTKTVHPTTTVNLTGGTIGRAFGGGLGRLEDGDLAAVAATVGGDVTVTLDGTKVVGYTDGTETVGANVFGANNINGTPLGHVLVHVKQTKSRDGHTYDVDAVFGGGNNADYVPLADDTKQYAEVIIEGCDLTSIEQVYGGGNAAATPGTLILVRGTKIIHELFGGGNGERGAEYAANVGYHYDAGTRTDYELGDGKALVQLMAGKIDYVYGGSNSNGDIRGGSTTSNLPVTGSKPDCCDDLQVEKVFGGGKNADMASGSDIIIECQTSSSWIEEIYAGAENANVGGNVRLTITSGKFGRVFGGNKSGGKLDGSITVNIEESPSCGIPVIIGELYAGGNKAPYSIYGYDGSTMLTSGTAKHASPVVNVRAFTSIGNIFGGGYGEKAVMYGSPTININEVEVDHTDKSNAEFQGNEYGGETKIISVDEGEESYSVVLHPHADGKMGVIGNVYGGGNAAKVFGDTNVNIGTKTTDIFHTPVKKTVHNSETDTDEEVATTSDDRTHEVKGADIRGNVYGGGNNAEVTGNTNVVIGAMAQ